MAESLQVWYDSAIWLYYSVYLPFFLSFSPLSSSGTEKGRILSLASYCQTEALRQDTPHVDAKHYSTIVCACMRALIALDADDYSTACSALHAVTHITSRHPTSIVRQVEMPLEEIITLLERQEVKVHMPETPAQLTIKRIILRTFIELFYVFGSSKLVLQARNNLTPQHTEDPAGQALTDNPLKRFKQCLTGELF